MINVREYRRGNQKGQSRETGNIGHTRRRKTKQKYNTICVGYHHTQTNTNNINKTWAFLQQLEVKTNQTNTNNINKTWALLQQLEVKTNWTSFYAEIERTSQHGTQNVKTHNRATQKAKKKMSNEDPTKKTGNDLRG